MGHNFMGHNYMGHNHMGGKGPGTTADHAIGPPFQQPLGSTNGCVCLGVGVAVPHDDAD